MLNIGKESMDKKLSQEASVDKSIVFNRYVQLVLGAESKNRLESILSESVIFAMNSGLWKHAENIQATYEMICKPYSIGPIVSNAYISMGYNKLSEAIAMMKSSFSNIAPADVAGLRVFLGMFLFFDGQKEAAHQELQIVLRDEQSASATMARQLLSDFFGKKMEASTKAQNGVRVPGLPM